MHRQGEKAMKNFHKKALKEIKWWAWAATVLPPTGLVTLFLIYFIGTETLYDLAIIIGVSALFMVSVIWWWWTLYTIASVTGILGQTVDKIEKVDNELKEIKDEVKGLQ